MIKVHTQCKFITPAPRLSSVTTSTYPKAKRQYQQHHQANLLACPPILLYLNPLISIIIIIVIILPVHLLLKLLHRSVPCYPPPYRALVLTVFLGLSSLLLISGGNVVVLEPGVDVVFVVLFVPALSKQACPFCQLFCCQWWCSTRVLRRSSPDVRVTTVTDVFGCV